MILSIHMFLTHLDNVGLEAGLTDMRPSFIIEEDCKGRTKRKRPKTSS
jgi:hypothetical protein